MSSDTDQKRSLAIVGMGIHWGAQTNLDAFERYVYEGIEAKLQDGSETGQLNQQQQWMLTAANEALQDAKCERGSAIAVIITSTSQSQVFHAETADLIRSLWRLSGGISTLAAQATPVVAALEAAQPCLAEKEAVLVGVVGDRGSSAILLKPSEAAMESCDRIYAVINAVNQGPPQIAAIDYLEVCGPALEAANLQNYSGSKLSCALGTLSPSYVPTSDLVSLIKTALCLYHRYLPAVPHWSDAPPEWQDGPFYVPTESRPWFVEDADRIAVLYLAQSEVNLLMSEAPTARVTSNRYLAQMPLRLVAIAAPNQSALLENLQSLQTQVTNEDSLSTVAHNAFRAFQKDTYTVVLLAKSKEELEREIERALQGVTRAISTGGDWQTPAGSYFTPQPLAQSGQVAFVYPGAFGAYVGLARTLFRLFPSLYDDPLLRSVSQRATKVGQILYPRSLKPLSNRQREQLEQRLLTDPLAMLETELAYASFATVILRDYFQIQPHCAFGYSLGETSMMFAQGIWSHFHEGSAAFHSSALFCDRLSGPKNAVREHWSLSDQDELAWSTYVLMAPVEPVKQCLASEPQVYLTQINTPEEVVIAGETAACERVVKALGGSAFRAPFNHAIHCEPMRSEFDELARLNTFPIETAPDLTLYSAADYQPLDLKSEAVGQSIAHNLCQSLDFPKLVNRVYADGARLFIETGAGSTTSRWIDRILGQQAHVTVSFNRRGLDEHTAITRALAKLLSHGVSMDLSPLFDSQPTEVERSPASTEILTKLSERLQASRLRTSLFQNLQADEASRSHGSQDKLVSPSRGVSKFSQQIARPSPPTPFPTSGEGRQSVVSTVLPPRPVLGEGGWRGEGHPQSYQMLHENNLQMARVHRHFLRSRQNSLQQMQDMLQLQLQVSQDLLQRRTHSQ